MIQKGNDEEYVNVWVCDVWVCDVIPTPSQARPVGALRTLASSAAVGFRYKVNCCYLSSKRLIVIVVATIKMKLRLPSSHQG